MAPAFRQQLANAQAVEGRQSEMLAGTIEAFLVAEEGLLNDGNGRDESPSGLCYVSTQNLLEHEQSTRSRSYSYGYLLGEAARRSGRRSTSHMKQLASSSMARLPGAMAIEESSALGEGTGGPVEAELAELRAENKLLRRQLESHPELYRLSAENRLLREHMARGTKGTWKRNAGLLSTEKEEPTVVEGGSRFELKHFPGIEEVTRLSSSGSESELEAPCREDRGSGEVTSFLPAMARQVPVDAAALAEALQGATQALQNAEAMVAKGSCGDLFVGIDEGGVLGDRVCSEGMDERDVFLSLMRSLPGESHALRLLASSVPQLPRPGIPSRCRSGSLESSSTGGGCLQRMKSTMQLHRIVEAPSLQEIEIESPARQGGGGDEEPADTPGDRLQLTIQQVQNLSKQLESIGEIHKEVKSQLEPMQQEYLRRLEEVRFLEAQCRRLDVHCRRLEELTVAAVRTPRERREGTGTPRAVRTRGCPASRSDRRSSAVGLAVDGLEGSATAVPRNALGATSDEDLLVVATAALADHTRVLFLDVDGVLIRGFGSVDQLGSANWAKWAKGVGFLPEVTSERMHAAKSEPVQAWVAVDDMDLLRQNPRLEVENFVHTSDERGLDVPKMEEALRKLLASG
eukprot:g24597.t1